MRIALVGTRGVPAAYGGFETAAEEIGRRLASRGHEVVVYCRSRSGPPRHLGMYLVHLPAVRVKALETLSHTRRSARHLRTDPVDVAVVFNPANAPFIPHLARSGIQVAVNVDGLEWKRGGRGLAGRLYSLAAEKLVCRWSNRVIVDSRAMADYYRHRHGADSTYIPYGAEVVEERMDQRLGELGLTSRGYHLIVARTVPENNVDLVVEAYVRSRARLPLAVVGSDPYHARYRARVIAAAAGDDRVTFLGSVYDQDLLTQLYANSASYIHGHSVGGTNPSLLRGMGAGVPVLALDVTFNREVAGDTARYFRSCQELAGLLDSVERYPAAAWRRAREARVRVARMYDWDKVAEGYEQVCFELRASRTRTPIAVAGGG